MFAGVECEAGTLSQCRVLLCTWLTATPREVTEGYASCKLVVPQPTVSQKRHRTIGCFAEPGLAGGARGSREMRRR